MTNFKLFLLAVSATVLIASCGSSTTTAAAITGEVLPRRVAVL
jgi:hypothetical protein